MTIILPISINLILCILLFIVYCVHVLYVRFDMCKINDSQSVSQSFSFFAILGKCGPIFKILSLGDS